MHNKFEINKWLTCAALTVLVSFGTRYHFLSFVAFAILSLGIILYNDIDAMCLLFFSMSFTHIFKPGPGTTSYFMYAFLLFVLWQTVRRKHFSQLMALMGVFTIELFVIQIVGDTINIIQTVKFMANLLFIYYVADIVEDGKQRDVYLAYIFGVLLASAVKLSGLFPEIEPYSGIDAYGRFIGLHADPNYYSVNVIISMCLIALLYHQRKIPLLYTAAMLGVFVYFVSLTQSKSSFIMLLLPFLMILYSNSHNRRYFVQILLIAGMVYFLSMFLSGEIDMFDAVLKRLDAADNVEELTTGRTVHWEDYWADSFSTLEGAVFGKGLGAPLIRGGGAHNAYLDILYFLGVGNGLGFILFLAILAKRYGEMHMHYTKSAMNIGAAVCVFMMYFFLSELHYFDMPFHIVLAIMAFYDDGRGDRMDGGNRLGDAYMGLGLRFEK